MGRMNALFNCKNKFQGDYPKALCLCSAGLLRSPTLAEVLISQGWNARAAGVMDYALIPVDDVLIEWADKILCVEKDVEDILRFRFDVSKKVVITLGIPDNFCFRDPKLVEIIKDKLELLNVS